MRKVHKNIACGIFLLVAVLAFFFDARITDITAQSLVVFFSIVFGFYMTSITVLYGSSYTKYLHKRIDEEAKKRGTHILKSYLLISSYWLIFSISFVIFYTTIAFTSKVGVLVTTLRDFAGISLDQLLISALFGVSAVNILFILLLLQTIIDAMVEEARE